MNCGSELVTVSVVIPVCNAEKQLEHTIKSVLSQTFSDFELILVDDGSTDRSPAICDEWKKRDDRIRVIHKENGGVSSARNVGIANSQGKYITFCDSDDYLSPDYLDTLIKTAAEHSGVGHIWCAFQTVAGLNCEDAKPCIPVDAPIQMYTLDSFMTLHELWLDSSPCNKLYKREIIKQSSLEFDKSLSLGEDLLFNMAYIDVSNNRDIVVVTKPLYNYLRASDGSLDTKYRRDLLDIYRKISARMLFYIEKWGLSEEQREKFNDSRFYMYEKVLRNTMRAPGGNVLGKISENSRFMQSAEFADVVSSRTCFVHPTYLRAYRSGHYLNVMLVDKAVKIKNILKKVLSK